MMLAFTGFASVLIIWVLYAFDMALATPGTASTAGGFLGNFIGQPGAVLNHAKEQGQAAIRSSAGHHGTSRRLRSSTSSSCSRRSRRC